MSGGRRRDARDGNGNERGGGNGNGGGEAGFAGALPGVRPLAGRDKLRPGPEPPVAARPVTARARRFVIEREGDDVFARAEDVSRRQLAELRAGRMAVERETDLHGLSPADAKRALHRALAGALRDGVRCLLVIHGAGHHSVSGPVLKRALPEWLEHAPAAGDILAFATAPARHGGPGASLVLLRRARRPER